jgi:hypothetical protein
MPYIETETVKAIRTKIKTTFPNFKFSVTREHYSSVRIVILKSDIPWNDFIEHMEHKPANYFTINPYWLKENYANKPKIIEFISDITNIVHGLEHPEIICEDGDYGSIPNYYLNILIGDYNKPYKQLN